MKLNKVLFVLVSFFVFSFNVNASVCDSEHLKQLEELARQVDVSYEYMDYYDQEGGEENKFLEEEGSFVVVNSYLVSVNLISDELYISNGYNDYYYSDSVNGIVSFYNNAGNLNLSIKSKRCAGYVVKNINIKLPKFNIYSRYSECDKLKDYNLDVCDPWYEGALNDVLFYNEVNKYLVNEDKGIIQVVFDFIKEYYLFIGGGIILIIGIIFGIKIHRKRSVLE